MRLIPLLALAGCAGADLGAIVDIDDLPATLERTAGAVRMVTPSSARPVECVVGRLGADTLEGAASAIRYDADADAAPLIGVSFGVCLLGEAAPPELPCKTHRALTLATAYASQLPDAVALGLRGESATLGGFSLPSCDETAGESVPEAIEAAPELAPESSAPTTDEVD